MVAAEKVFTVTEVARALRVSDETIRRKIGAGELNAVEISSKPRKQYRILYRDLVDWIGSDRARILFGVGEVLDQVRELLATVPEAEQEKLLKEAIAWSRERRPERKPTGKKVSSTAIAARFKK